MKEFKSYLIDEPYGIYPYALSYDAGEDIGDNNEVESIAERLGVEIEWASSPVEDEDGSGYWPFLVRKD